MALSCPADFYFHIDALLFQPKEDGLEVAIQDNNGPGYDITGGRVLGFSTEHHDWDWDWGFRLGLGFYLNHDAWTLDLNWMWFKINEEVDFEAQNVAVVIPLWLPPVSGLPTLTNTTTSARWHLQMNVFDISLGKPYHVSRYMIMNPFFGLRAAWFDQNYTARYGGLFPTQSGAQMDSKNDYWGVGARAGMNSEWLFGGGFSVLSNLSFSMLYSKFDVDQDLSLTGGGYSFDSEFYQNQVNMELQLGVSWGIYFNENRNHLAIQALYEFQEWWDHNWLRRPFNNPSTLGNDTVARGNLTLNGASFRLLFDF